MKRLIAYFVGYILLMASLGFLAFDAESRSMPMPSYHLPQPIHVVYETCAIDAAKFANQSTITINDADCHKYEGLYLDLRSIPDDGPAE